MEDGRWYVYALLSSPEGIRDPLASAFYIGKGCGSRRSAHTREVQSLIDGELPISSAKQKVIRNALTKFEQVPSVRLGPTYDCERDAYAAESMLIALINRQRDEVGAERLANVVAGHSDRASDFPNDGLVDLDEYFAFTDSVDYEISQNGANVGILVKANESVAYNTPVRRDRLFLADDGSVIDTIACMSYGKARNDREAWNPNRPWHDSVARRRAARYWTFSRESVISWVQGVEDRPTVCALAVPHSGRSTVRYVWEIDYGNASNPWQFFPAVKGPGQWGIPLGRRLLHKDSILLGKALVERSPKDQSQLRQALYARPKGCRVFRFD